MRKDTPKAVENTCYVQEHDSGYKGMFDTTIEVATFLWRTSRFLQGLPDSHLPVSCHAHDKSCRTVVCEPCHWATYSRAKAIMFLLDKSKHCESIAAKMQSQIVECGHAHGHKRCLKHIVIH